MEILPSENASLVSRTRGGRALSTGLDTCRLQYSRRPTVSPMATARARMTDLPAHDRPRERLRRLGADALTDAEVLALMIGSGRPGTNAVDVAQRLIHSLGGIAGLAAATVDEVERVPGIGPAAACRIVAAAELRRRVALGVRPAPVSGTEGVAAAVLPHLQDRRRERVVLAVLDRSLRVREVVCIAEGTVGHAWLPVSEIVQAVLLRHGHAFAVAHNHPGGRLDPSEADVLATQRLRAAAAACGLRFLDHLIVAGEQWRAIA